VLPPGTERYDRGAKFEQYRERGPLREYVLVAQDAHAVDVFRLENGH
jgi:Uma2 family endonuclease